MGRLLLLRLAFAPVIGDNGDVCAALDAVLAERGVRLLHPSSRNRAPRPGARRLTPIRRLIESVDGRSAPRIAC